MATESNGDGIKKATAPKRKEDPANKHLTPEVLEAFEVVNWHGSHRQVFGIKFGVIDLTELTPISAGRLVRKGFHKLRAREK